MPATTSEITRLRDETGHTDASLTDAKIQTFWTTGNELYPSLGREVWYQYVKYTVLNAMAMSAARMVTYKENEASETLSDIYKHLVKERDLTKAELDKQINKARGGLGIKTFTTKRVPAIVRDEPSS